MHKSLFAMLVSLGLMACFPDPPTGGGGGGGGGGGVDAAPPADPCTPTTADGNATAGFPYDLEDFKTNILPKLQGGTGCELTSGCHGLGSPSILFQVFSGANPGNGCPEVETFNQVVARSSYVNGGAMSDIVKKIDGTLTHTYPATGPASVELTPLLTAFIDNAKTNYEMGGGGGGGGNPADAFDADLFASQIQPILSNANCMNTGCHNIEQGTLGGEFGLHPRALAGSAELQTNIANVVSRIDTSLPAAQATMTEFYDRCTDSHTGSVVGNPQAIEDWIAAGLTALASQ